MVGLLRERKVEKRKNKSSKSQTEKKLKLKKKEERRKKCMQTIRRLQQMEACGEHFSMLFLSLPFGMVERSFE
jgi:hypothetical protein